MMLVSRRMRTDSDRHDIDEEAHQVVLDAYRDASHARPTVAFQTALEVYRRKFPHVRRDVASHAVAYILATAEL